MSCYNKMIKSGLQHFPYKFHPLNFVKCSASSLPQIVPHVYLGRTLAFEGCECHSSPVRVPNEG